MDTLELMKGNNWNGGRRVSSNFTSESRLAYRLMRSPLCSGLGTVIALAGIA